MGPTTFFRLFSLFGTFIAAPAMAIDQRDEVVFRAWAARIEPELLLGYEKYLSTHEVLGVAPLHELLRTSSDWATSACGQVEAQPFEIPPRGQWDHQARTLTLIKLLTTRQVLPKFEIVSAYRNDHVESCSGGAGKRHPTGGAFDLVPKNPSDFATTVKDLCKFWREEGPKYSMGFSVYPSGRIHIDTVKYSTWGRNGRKNTAVCLKK